MDNQTKSKHRMKLWLGVGTFVLAGYGSAQAASQVPQQPLASDRARPRAEITWHSERWAWRPMPLWNAMRGGEGGEAGTCAKMMPPALLGKVGGTGGEGGEGGRHGGEGGERGADANMGGALLACHLYLMEGHLRVALEALERGDETMARSHFAHPVQEVYEQVAGALERRGASALKPALEALLHADNAAALREHQAAALARLREALDTIPAPERDAPSFVTGVSLALLRIAAYEYWAAVEGGNVVNRVEYMDARGFTLATRDLLRRNAQTLRGRDSAATESLLARVDELLAVIPHDNPAEGKATSISRVLGLVSAAEFQVNAIAPELSHALGGEGGEGGESGESGEGGEGG